jgi:hypothetical protein
MPMVTTVEKTNSITAITKFQQNRYIIKVVVIDDLKAY